MYFQPIKNDDPQLDFYTMYKRETVQYDTGYMQKYNDDLNTTLIFVCSSFPLIVVHADHDPRLDCFPPSALPSPSPSNPTSSRTQENGQKRTSERSSSASIRPFLLTRILPPPLHGVVRPRKSLQH